MAPWSEEIPNDEASLLEVRTISIAEGAGPAARPHGRWTRLAGGTAAFLAATAGVAAWRGRCVPLAGSSARSLTSFVETYPSEMVNLVERTEDHAAIFRWLEAASVVKKTPSLGSDIKAANEAVNRAMETKDPQEVKRIMDEAVHRSVAETLARRQSLKQFITSNRRGLRTVPAPSPPADEAGDTEAAPGPDRAAVDGDEIEGAAAPAVVAPEQPKESDAVALVAEKPMAAEDEAVEAPVATVADKLTDEAANVADKPEATGDEAVAPPAAIAADKPEAAAGRAAGPPVATDEAVAPLGAAKLKRPLDHGVSSAGQPADVLGSRHYRDYVPGHGDGRRPNNQERTAYCVFDVLQAANSFAYVAANLNDAIKTCPDAKLDKMFDPNDKTSSKACAVNVATVFSELSYLASMLALAANDCATTMAPNTDALCAADIAGLVWSVGNIAASGALMGASCKTDSDFPVDDVPSRVGSTGVRRLEEEAAPARNLLFGGGIPSTGGQCGLEITDILWSMARFALMINSAATGNTHRSDEPVGQCPPNGEDSNPDDATRAFCSFHVAGILTFYARVVEFIQLAIEDCADVMNLDAVCGAGVTGMFASASGVASTGSVVAPSCDFMQDPLLQTALHALTGNKGELLATIGHTLLGRRLAEVEKPTMLDFAYMTDADLFQRFGSPEKAFKSIGVDITDSNAAFRTHRRPQVPDAASVAKLFEQPEEQSLFGSTCSS